MPLGTVSVQNRIRIVRSKPSILTPRRNRAETRVRSEAVASNPLRTCFARALGRAVSPRMTVAYRSQYPAAQTGDSPEEKQHGRRTKKMRPAPSLTPTAETESEIPLAVGPVPTIIAATPRRCTGPQAQGIVAITRRIWVIRG